MTPEMWEALSIYLWIIVGLTAVLMVGGVISWWWHSR